MCGPALRSWTPRGFDARSGVRARMIPPPRRPAVEVRSDPAVSAGERRAQLTGDRTHDAQDRSVQQAEDEQHEQRQVLVEIDVLLMRPSVAVWGVVTRTVAAG